MSLDVSYIESIIYRHLHPRWGDSFSIVCTINIDTVVVLLELTLLPLPRSAAWKSLDFDIDIVHTLINNGSLLLSSEDEYHLHEALFWKDIFGHNGTLKPIETRGFESSVAKESTGELVVKSAVSRFNPLARSLSAAAWPEGHCWHLMLLPLVISLAWTMMVSGLQRQTTTKSHLALKTFT